MSKSIFDNRILMHMIYDCLWSIDDFNMHKVAEVFEDHNTAYGYTVIDYPTMNIEVVKNSYMVLTPPDIEIESEIVELFLTKFVINNLSEDVSDYIRSNYFKEGKEPTDDEEEGLERELIEYIKNNIDIVFDIDESDDNEFTIELVEG